MNPWVLGAFFTEGTPYQAVVEQYLLKSCENFPNIRTIVRVGASYGNWNRNVAEKPKIILDILESIPSEQCLVFVDADATIEQYPTLFDTINPNIDVAFHMLDWNDWYGYECGTLELLTGTMFFRNNDKVKAMCQEWYDCAVQSNEWEQKVLQNIIVKHIHKGLHTQFLPIEYCYMVSRPGGRPPLVKAAPVILHHQVSRELKRNIK